LPLALWVSTESRFLTLFFIVSTTSQRVAIPFSQGIGGIFVRRERSGRNARLNFPWEQKFPWSTTETAGMRAWLRAANSWRLVERIME
jgi:hypothetical protein